MKTVVRCANCSQIKRRSFCYRIKLIGKMNDSTILEKPSWIDYIEKCWLCRRCASLAGYKVKEENVKVAKKNSQENIK